MSERVAASRAWNALVRDASVCERCDLHETRNVVVFGDGDPDAGIVLVGSVPGRHEDLTGRPFEGAVGNLLDNLLAEAGLTREDVYLSNVVKCHPPASRAPFPDEVETCLPWLGEQLRHISPKVIVTFGSLPSRVVLRRDVPIEKVSGFRFPMNGATVIPTYDLAAALKGSPKAMSALKRDVRTAKAVADGRVAPAEAMLEGLRSEGAPAT